MDTTPLPEVDFWLSCLPGSDFEGLRVGQKVTNKDKEIFTVVGFGTDYILSEDAEKKTKADLDKIKTFYNFRDGAKVLCLYESGKMH